MQETLNTLRFCCTVEKSIRQVGEFMHAFDEGVDHVVEVGGAGTLTRSFGAIRVGGKISLIGGLSGPATELNPGLILARRANVQGISVGSTQMFEAMNRAIAANGIKPVIDKVFGFDEVQTAYKHMASGAHFGKIVIRLA